MTPGEELRYRLVLKDLGLLTPAQYFDAAKWLAVGYQSGLIAGRKETADVFADTVQALS
jgi:hypothetical protein